MKFAIYPILVFWGLFLPALYNALIAQSDRSVSEATLNYQNGNYEKSLKILRGINDSTLIKQTFIMRNILFAENYIALHLSEDSIRQKLINIYKIDPNFEVKSLNIDISDALSQRLGTIVRYPRIIESLMLSLNYLLPVFVNNGYVCTDCVNKDKYSYFSFGPSVEYRFRYMLDKNKGFEIGIGFKSAYYSRTLNSSVNNNDFTLTVTENMQFLIFPVHFCRYYSDWLVKAGFCYYYNSKSNLTGNLTNTSIYNEQITTAYTKPNNEKNRNKNLILFSCEINKKLFNLKSKSWCLNAGGQFQIAINSFTQKSKKYSDIYFVSDTNYTDDMIRLCFFSLNVSLSFNANHFVR